MQPSGSSQCSADIPRPPLAGLYGIITIKKMEGKLERQHALFCFWLDPAHTRSGVCMLLGTVLPRLIACHNTLPCDAILWILDTSPVFFADALLAILVYFGTPPSLGCVLQLIFVERYADRCISSNSSVKIMQGSHC